MRAEYPNQLDYSGPEKHTRGSQILNFEAVGGLLYVIGVVGGGFFFFKLKIDMCDGAENFKLLLHAFSCLDISCWRLLPLFLTGAWR